MARSRTSHAKLRLWSLARSVEDNGRLAFHATDAIGYSITRSFDRYAGCRCIWRYGEAAVGRSRRTLPVPEAAGTRPFHLASGRQRIGLADARAALDAVRRDRLETTGTDCGTCLGRVRRDERCVQDSSVFFAVNLWGLMAYFAHGLSQQQELLSHRSEIEHLKLLIAKLRRMQFGRRSEKVERQIEQLELARRRAGSEPLGSRACVDRPAISG